MADKRTERYFKLFRKNNELFGALLKNKKSRGDKQKVVLCLTEIYFSSQSAIKLIDKISKTNKNFTKGDLDFLLGNLIDLQTEIYLDMTDWIKDLKKLLKNVIDKVGKLGGDKSGTNAARKTIQSSKKRFDINLKKIRYYTTHCNPKKKPRG